MGTAKWWICDSCKSLNDLPASKCYKCRESKGADPMLIDDQYSKVGGGEKRVGITVDLSQVGDLTRPDPLETQDGGGIMERFETDERRDIYADVDAQQAQPSGAGPAVPDRADTPRVAPLREPERRGITAAGGQRLTGEILDELPPWSPDQAPGPAAPPPGPGAPPPGPGAPPPGSPVPGGPPPGAPPPPPGGPPGPPPQPGAPPPGYAPPPPPGAGPLPPGYAPPPPPGAGPPPPGYAPPPPPGAGPPPPGYAPPPPPPGAPAPPGSAPPPPPGAPPLPPRDEVEAEDDGHP